jgi:hypothetical protein
MSEQTPALAAYAAYGAATGQRTHDGRPMPQWDKLGGPVQAAWTAAAAAVLAQAAEAVLAARIAQPLGEAEESTNWALEHLAQQLRTLADPA